MLKHHLKRDSLFSSRVIFLAVAVLLLAGGVFLYREFFGLEASNLTVLGSFEYSAPECLNGNLWLAVFNSGDVDVLNISVSSGDKVYAKMDLLEPDSPSAFAIGPCNSTDQSKLIISYCAGTCKTEPLNPKGNEMGPDPACTPSAGNSTPS